MPAGSPPHKKNDDILGASLRYKMVEKAIEGYEGFEVSDYEIWKKGYSYTHETLEHFKKEDNEIYFITGADCLLDIEKWNNPGKILELSNFVVFNRPGYDDKSVMKQKEKINKKYNTNIRFLDIINLEISSSMIRKRIREGKRVNFFLSQEVLEFIVENKIYK